MSEDKGALRCLSLLDILHESSEEIQTHQLQLFLGGTAISPSISDSLYNPNFTMDFDLHNSLDSMNGNTGPTLPYMQSEGWMWDADWPNISLEDSMLLSSNSEVEAATDPAAETPNFEAAGNVDIVGLCSNAYLTTMMSNEASVFANAYSRLASLSGDDAEFLSYDPRVENWYLQRTTFDQASVFANLCLSEPTSLRDEGQWQVSGPSAQYVSLLTIIAYEGSAYADSCYRQIAFSGDEDPGQTWALQPKYVYLSTHICDQGSVCADCNFIDSAFSEKRTFREMVFESVWTRSTQHNGISERPSLMRQAYLLTRTLGRL